ncbi:hypothetical protein FRB94_002526 [Tulasnella sp. JGI-2019a]|nr:hypothetical protein FRB94_002526 [Tulasnella sp. JGI-2019a]
MFADITDCNLANYFKLSTTRMPPHTWNTSADAYVKQKLSDLGLSTVLDVEIIHATMILQIMADHLGINIVVPSYVYLSGDDQAHALEVIKACVESGTYEEALQLDFFEINPPSAQTSASASARTDQYLYKQATEKVWQHPFSEESHLLLKFVIDKMATSKDNENPAYAN